MVPGPRQRGRRGASGASAMLRGTAAAGHSGDGAGRYNGSCFEKTTFGSRRGLRLLWAAAAISSGDIAPSVSFVAGAAAPDGHSAGSAAAEEDEEVITDDRTKTPPGASSSTGAEEHAQPPAASGHDSEVLRSSTSSSTGGSSQAGESGTPTALQQHQHQQQQSLQGASSSQPSISAASTSSGAASDVTFSGLRLPIEDLEDEEGAPATSKAALLDRTATKPPPAPARAPPTVTASLPTLLSRGAGGIEGAAQDPSKSAPAKIAGIEQPEEERLNPALMRTAMLAVKGQGDRSVGGEAEAEMLILSENDKEQGDDSEPPSGAAQVAHHTGGTDERSSQPTDDATGPGAAGGGPQQEDEKHSASLDMKNAPITSFAFLSLLLLCGKVLRVLIKPLRDLYLPSSVVGGSFGYLLLLLAKNVGPKGCVPDDHINRYSLSDLSVPEEQRGQCLPGITEVYSYISAYYTIGWGPQLPEVLISVIFAAVFIGVEVPPVKAIWEGSGPQIMYGQVVTHGLWFWGLLAGWAFGTMFLVFEENQWSYFWTGTQEWTSPDGKLPDGKSADWLPKCYGISMYLGFEGGHGTVAGLRDDFPKMQDWKDGFDVSIGMATTGLLGATIWGVMLINIASRRGWRATGPTTTSSSGERGANPDGQPQNQGSSSDPLLLVGVYSEESRRPMAYETVVSDSIDTLTLHAALIGLACAFGYGIQKAMIALQEFGSDTLELYPKAATTIGENFPLFPLCMVGGIIVDRLIRTIGYSMLIDHNCMQRVSGIALDYLITAVLCTMDLQAATGWPYATIAFVVLNVVGFAWHFFCILFLAPKMLPDAWFERAIFEVGHSMGTTANGLILLKMVDPHSETAAGSAIAFKLFAHEPVMGVWVALISTCFKAPMSTRDGGFWILVWAGLSAAVMAFWFALYLFYFRPKYKTAWVTDRKTFLSDAVEKGSRHGSFVATSQIREFNSRLSKCSNPCADLAGVNNSSTVTPPGAAESGIVGGGNSTNINGANYAGSSTANSSLLNNNCFNVRTSANHHAAQSNQQHHSDQRQSSTELGHLMALSSQNLRLKSQTWGYADAAGPQNGRATLDGIFVDGASTSILGQQGAGAGVGVGAGGLEAMSAARGPIGHGSGNDLVSISEEEGTPGCTEMAVVQGMGLCGTRKDEDDDDDDE